MCDYGTSFPTCEGIRVIKLSGTWVWIIPKLRIFLRWWHPSFHRYNWFPYTWKWSIPKSSASSVAWLLIFLEFKKQNKKQTWYIRGANQLWYRGGTLQMQYFGFQVSLWRNDFLIMALRSDLIRLSRWRDEAPECYEDDLAARPVPAAAKNTTQKQQQQATDWSHAPLNSRVPQLLRIITHTVTWQARAHTSSCHMSHQQPS